MTYANTKTSVRFFYFFLLKKKEKKHLVWLKLISSDILWSISVCQTAVSGCWWDTEPSPSLTSSPPPLSTQSRTSRGKKILKKCIKLFAKWIYFRHFVRVLYFFISILSKERVKRESDWVFLWGLEYDLYFIN